MNTLNDLRDTFDHHAHDVHDDPSRARLAAVRGRVRRSRQRRAGAVVVSAALAVVGVVALPALVDRTPPVPAERLLAGQVAPAELTSLGYTYEFEGGTESGDGAATVRLDRSDAPRLITWASDAEQVRLRSSSADDRTSPDTRFDDFVVVGPGERGRWTLRAHGADSALAVYTLTDDLPTGVTVGGLHFRGQVGSDEIAAAVMGSRGKGETSLEFTVPESRSVRLAEFCQGVPVNEEFWVNVEVDDQGSMASQGCDDDRFDPATGNSTWLDSDQLPSPGTTVRVRMWVSRGFEGPPVHLDEAQLGLAVYEVGEPAAVVAGWDMPQLYEHEGQVWSFVSAEQSQRGAGFMAIRNSETGPVLAVGSYSGAGPATVEFRAPGSGADYTRGSGNGSGLVARLEPLGQASLDVVREIPRDSTRLGFALYERVG